MTALYIRFHRWHGFLLPNAEPDLFSHVFKFGWVSVFVCRKCLLDARHKLRVVIQAAIDNPGPQDPTGRG